MNIKPLKFAFAKLKVALVASLLFAMPAIAFAEDVSYDEDYYADEKAFYEANGLEWIDPETGLGEEIVEDLDLETEDETVVSDDSTSGNPNFEVETMTAWFYDRATNDNVKKTVTTVGMYSEGVALEADVPAMVIDGTTLVPIRFVGDLLGATIGWDSEIKEAIVQTEEKIILLDVGSEFAIVNNEKVELSTGVSVELVVYDGIARTLVPLRFVSEQLGATVNYDETTHTIDIIPYVPEIDEDDVDAELDVEADLDADLDESDDSDNSDFVFDENATWAEWIYTDPVKVIIDPGHGGTDPGAVYYDTYEGDINWSIALKFAELLDEAGIEYVFTREEDTYVALKDRAAVTQTEHGTVFVSIHCNSSTSTSVTGLETYGGIMAENPTPDVNGEIYNFVQADNGFEFAQIMQSALIATTAAKDRGAKQECYIVLNQNAAPGVLIEAGFMTNETEFNNLVNDEYQYKIAQGMVDGVLAYFDVLGVDY